MNYITNIPSQGYKLYASAAAHPLTQSALTTVNQWSHYAGTKLAVAQTAIQSSLPATIVAVAAVSVVSFVAIHKAANKLDNMLPIGKDSNFYVIKSFIIHVGLVGASAFAVNYFVIPLLIGSALSTSVICASTGLAVYLHTTLNHAHESLVLKQDKLVLKQDKIKLENQINKINNDNEKLTKYNEKYGKDLYLLSNSFNLQKNSFDDYKNKFKSESFNQLNQNLVGKISQIEGLEKVITDKEDELNKLNVHLFKLTDKVNTQDMEIKSAKDSCIVANELNDKKDIEINEKEETIVKLNKEILELNKIVEEMKQKLENMQAKYTKEINELKENHVNEKQAFSNAAENDNGVPV